LVLAIFACASAFRAGASLAFSMIRVHASVVPVGSKPFVHAAKSSANAVPLAKRVKKAAAKSLRWNINLFPFLP
jgi:hypothetical protein